MEYLELVIMKKKLDGKKVFEKGGKTLNEFKQFISRGNVLDMAVGVIIGSAFGKIVTSVVNDILMPLKLQHKLSHQV